MSIRPNYTSSDNRDECDVCGLVFYVESRSSWFNVAGIGSNTWDTCAECRRSLPKVYLDAKRFYNDPNAV